MLTHLKLQNFRNHQKFEIEFADVTAIIGDNGVGKSNILEAIVLLSFCRSYRDDDKKNLVMLEKEYARVVGDNLEVFLQKEPSFLMKVKKDDVWKRQTDFVGNLPAVVFSPETMAIITGSPKERRRFLDIMISQVDKSYLRALSSYEKVRKQRNSLLSLINEGRQNQDGLDFWDQRLVEDGEVIIRKREESIEFLNSILSRLYADISGEKSRLEIKYDKISDLAGELNRKRQRDIILKKTTVGPHVDDIIFELDNMNMSNYASRGEIRSAILSLKIAELEYLESRLRDKEIDKKPLLLLDDVYSEFDPKRREHLGGLIAKYQTIITTTEKEFLSADLLKSCKVIYLN